MTPVKLFKAILFPIVVSPDITKSPEVIGAIIQAIAGILAALLGVVFPLFIQERKKSNRLELEIDNLKQLVSENTDELQKIKEHIKDVDNPKLTNDINEIIKNNNERLAEIAKAKGAWKNAYVWFKKERKSLTRKAVNDVFEMYPDFKKVGGSLASQKQRNDFQLSLEDRLGWVETCLKYTKKVPLELIKDKWVPRIAEPALYQIAYDFIKQQVRAIVEDRKSSLSRDGAYVLQSLIDSLNSEETP